MEPQWEACGSGMKDVKPGRGKGCEEAHSQGQVGPDPASLAVDALGGTKGFWESSGLILRHLTSQPAAHERQGSMRVCRGARTPEISAVCGYAGFWGGEGFQSLSSDSQRVLYVQDVKFEGIRSRFPFLLSDTKVNLIQSHLFLGFLCIWTW